MLIRINDEERAKFITLCEELDTSAAREVRRFIRDFISINAKKLDGLDTQLGSKYGQSEKIKERNQSRQSENIKATIEIKKAKEKA